MIVVVDINVLIGARTGAGASALVVEHCVRGQPTPFMGAALFAEYEDVPACCAVRWVSRLKADERHELLDRSQPLERRPSLLCKAQEAGEPVWTGRPATLGPA